MKIGLIHPFYSYEEDKNNRPFPFGVAYIANYLIQKGYEAEILDLNDIYLKKDEIVNTLKRMKCDIIGISALSGGFTYVKNLVSLIKANFDTPVIIGGPLGTHNAETVLTHTQADICVIGQGEGVTRDLLDNVDNLGKVNGIVYKDRNGVIIRNAPAALVELDTVPWPAYQIMRMDNYIWDGASADMDSKRRYKKGLRIAQMITGRGCPMGCNFCSKVMGNKAFVRSPDKIIEEIKFLMKEYKINGAYFRDELYLMNRKHALELSAKLKPLGIIWMGQARVDRVDYDLIRHMKDCGCVSLGFGIESGSPKMLKLMNKGQTVEQIEAAVRNCKKLDMDMKVQLVMGYPGEDRNTIEETIQLFKKLGHPGRRFNLITPLPGSVLYEDIIKRGIISNECEYLIGLSKRDSGFGKGLPLINLTQFSDEQLYKIKLDTERTMEQNYHKYFWTHPEEIFQYLRDTLIYKGYLFHPMGIIIKIMEKLASVYWKGNKLNKKTKAIKPKSAEYQLTA